MNYIKFILLIFLTSSSAFTAEPDSLTRAIETTWLLKVDDTQTLTPTECQERPELNLKKRWHWQLDPTNSKDDHLLVSFGDSFSPTGLSQIRIWLHQENLQKNKLEFYDDARVKTEVKDPNFELLVNHVNFKPRSGASHIIREVYFGDTEQLEKIEDRLRLAVNDIAVLNPWHRAKDLQLRSELALDTTTVFRSKPQRALLDFFVQLYRNGELAKGVLGQMPTGMGKTEVAIDFFQHLEKDDEDYRVLWLTNGIDLLDDTFARVSPGLKGGTTKSFLFHSQNEATRAEKQQLGQGGFDHLFGSMDSFTADHPAQRKLLERWITSSAKPVFIVMDESHALGAESYKQLYDWLWTKHNDRIKGRVALTATPIHSRIGALAKYFPHVHYALIEDDEIDEDTLLPTLSFVAQTMRAAERGYLAIPLVYQLSHALETDDTEESLYAAQDLSRISDLISAFMPAKALLYHKGGVSKEFGATSRARQFQASWEETHPAQFSRFLSSAISSEERRAAIKDFRQQKTGVLNLTKLASQGIDLADVNLIGLLDQSKSLSLVHQRLGRGLRLSPGKPITRVLDYTGENIAVLYWDLASVFAEKKFAGKRAKIKALLKKIDFTAGAAIDAITLQEVYEVLAIDPTQIRASSEAQLKFLRISQNLTLAVDFVVRPAEQQSSSIVLPQPEDEESLRAYLKRVIPKIGERAGFRNVKESLTKLTQGLIFDLCKDDIAVDEKQLKSAVNVAFGAVRKSYEIDIGVVFSVKAEREQNSKIKLPQPDDGEKSLTYMKRIIPIIGERAGFRDVGETLIKLTEGKIFHHCKDDIAADKKQLKESAKNALAELRISASKIEGVAFSVNAVEGLI